MRSRSQRQRRQPQTQQQQRSRFNRDPSSSAAAVRKQQALRLEQGAGAAAAAVSEAAVLLHLMRGESLVGLVRAIFRVVVSCLVVDSTTVRARSVRRRGDASTGRAVRVGGAVVRVGDIVVDVSTAGSVARQCDLYGRVIVEDVVVGVRMLLGWVLGGLVGNVLFAPLYQ